MSLSEDAPGLTVHCITEKPKDMDPSMTSEWKIFNVLWHTQPTHFFITVGGSLIPLFLLFIYIIYFQSIFKWNSSKTSSGDNPEKAIVLVFKYDCQHPENSAQCFPLPKCRLTFKDYKKGIRLIFGVERGVLRWAGFLRGVVSLVESNGLLGAQGSA